MCLLHQAVHEGRLPVVKVSDQRNVTDQVAVVHEVCQELNLSTEK